MASRWSALSAVDAEHQHVGDAPGAGGVEREFQVGGVLRRRVALHLGAGVEGFDHHARWCGVEVADEEVDVQPGGERVHESRVGGDDARVGREMVECVGWRWITTREDDSPR